jgi:hypothetical protein
MNNFAFWLIGGIFLAAVLAVARFWTNFLNQISDGDLRPRKHTVNDR